MAKREKLLPKVLELAEQGRPASYIARELGVSVSAVMNWAKRECIALVHGRLTMAKRPAHPHGLPNDGAAAAEELRSVARYVPSTGEFFWSRPQGCAPVGRKFGWVNPEGYVVASVFNKTYPLHRLAWLYVHGEWPTSTIDHINRVRHDNRIANLRDVPLRENLQNTVRAKLHPELPPGIQKTRYGTYTARVFVGAGRHRHLGTFNDPNTAHAVRLAALAEQDAEGTSQRT